MTTSGGSTARRTARAAVTAAVALPLAAGLLVAAAPAASAAVTQPGDGTVFTADTTIALRADHPRGTSSLSLTSPGGPEVTVASGGSQLEGGTLSYALDTGCWTFPSSSCSGRVPAPNGTWVVTQSGSATDRVTFVLRIPPQAPAAVSAEAVDPRQVRLSWRRGAEPDLRGYVVSEDGRPLRQTAMESCDASVCTTTIGYAQDAPGSHTYAVTALRSDGGSGTLESAPSSASATLAEPARPEPAPTTGDGPADGSTGTPPAGGGASPGSGDGGASSGSGADADEPGGSGGTTAPRPGTSGAPRAGSSGSPTAGSGASAGAPLAVGTAAPSQSATERAVAQRKAFALGFSAFGPKLGIPKLPPLPQAPSPDVAPLPDGTYEPTLGFSDQVVTERVETGTAAGPAARVTSAVERALDSEQLVKSTAGALVLLLCGAHLRRWLASGSSD